MADIQDPEFWRSLGIEPIVINPNDQDSIDTGLEKLDEAIKDASANKPVSADE